MAEEGRKEEGTRKGKSENHSQRFRNYSQEKRGAKIDAKKEAYCKRYFMGRPLRWAPLIET